MKSLLLIQICLTILLIFIVGNGIRLIVTAISERPVMVERTVNYDIQEDFYELIREVKR